MDYKQQYVLSFSDIAIHNSEAESKRKSNKHIFFIY